MRAFFLLLVLFFSNPSYAQYKCVESGRTWYTNTPCVAAPSPQRRPEEQKTAAEIQAEFDQEVAAKRAAEAQVSSEANDREKSTVTETQTPTTPPPSKTPEIRKSWPASLSIWHYGVIGIFLYVIPSVIAILRGHHQIIIIILINLFLGWTYVGWVVALIWSATAAKQPVKNNLTPEKTGNDDDNGDIHEQRHAELRADIQRAVSSHPDATALLQALARLDGTTAEAERRIIFNFLKQQGAKLNSEHFPYFYGHHAGEFNHAEEDELIGKFLHQLQATTIAYRIDVIAAACAIVATGGTPKKREAETLARIRAALTPTT